MSTFDYWHVVHLVDEASPLWPLRKDLHQQLQSIEISLTAYDPYFSQPVKLYARYAKHEIIHGCRFEQMEFPSEDGTFVSVDHAKLDAYTTEATAKRRKHRRCSWTSLGSART